MSVTQAADEGRSAGDEQRYVRAADLLWRTIPGNAVILLRSVDQDVVILSGTGLALWEELAVPRVVDEVAARFAARYGVAPAVIAAGLDGVLAELRDRGIVCCHAD